MLGERVGAAFIGLALLVLVPTAALAQAESDQDDARAYFEQGRAAYAARRYADAARLFRRAYLLSSRPALLYNVGQAELRLGHDSLALEAFQGFLRRSREPGEIREEVEERVRVLRSMGVTPATDSEVAEAVRAARENQPAASGGASGESPAPASAGVDPAPWIVVGVGAAVLITGAVLLGVAASEAARIKNAADGSTWRGEYERVASDAQTMWLVGWIALGVGAAAAAGGIVWAVVPSGSSGESAELRVAPNGLVLAGRFR